MCLAILNDQVLLIKPLDPNPYILKLHTLFNYELPSHKVETDVLVQELKKSTPIKDDLGLGDPGDCKGIYSILPNIVAEKIMYPFTGH